ncbi:Peptidase A24B, FlaK domain protein [Methanocaldococcus vulcanius M7]|uniref:Peptidase A24B, FlaK domain protein n=1 Tax=Methanocaldococcus vulcanius (strain ATCC 700851 / DSM 12094 / M7) TaxID=579137 RepID=C9REH0_METVM|nr:preflagellin peptidase FlaK [Methanocaldococcus vulcanius]ACX71972.1 Peptidase A24B, FlaK domain protein [Methanocaldococcus vulcanius M7]
MEINYLIGLVGLIIASICDLKDREINDCIWIFITIFGFLYWGYFSFLMHNFIYIGYSVVGFLICFAIGYIMFLFGVGGGDGKLLMGLGALIPKYKMPIFTPFGNLLNISLIPSFPLMVLINAIFLSIFLPIIIFLKNVAKGVKPETKKEFICMFIGEKMKVATAKEKERLIMGTQDNINFLPSAEDACNFLKFDDNEEVWATPAIPFAIPLLVSYILTPYIGDKIIYMFLSMLGLSL